MRAIICKCGSTDFNILESLLWKSYFDEDSGQLIAHNIGNEIDSITCKKCGEELDNIDEIEINFQ